MNIIPLSQRPELASILAHWHVAQWHDLYEDWTVTDALAELQTHTAATAVPFTLVALDELDATEPIGSVSVVTEDLPGWEQLGPWLASLYVRSDRRANGAGSHLVEAAVAVARSLGVPCLYLYTPIHETFYRKRGWTFVARTILSGQPVTILSQTL